MPTQGQALPHPFCLTEPELLPLLRSLEQSRQMRWPVAEMLGESGRRKKRPEVSGRWQQVICAMPTYRLGETLLPQHSGDSDKAAAEPGLDASGPAAGLKQQDWQIQGVWLTALEAVQLLESLPLSSVQDDSLGWLGADLRFWSHLARWRLDLLARGKFLPELVTQKAAQARWQVIIDSATDRSRLEHFSRQMPGVCGTYRAHTTSESRFSGSTPTRLILDFLNGTIDAQVRAAAGPPPPGIAVKEVALREWVQALGPSGSTAVAEPLKLERLAASLGQWMAPVQRQAEVAAFRMCLYLHPPAYGTDWTLEYFLQSAHEPAFLISAKVIWNNPVDRLDYMGRTIRAPQETLLSGLGLASRLYPVLEPSLQTAQPKACQLNPLQVYEFIKSTAWRLQDSGFGVVLPPSLANQEGWANRLGLRVQAETPKSGQRLGLQSLLNFKWELTIGGQRLTKAEFDRLVALGTPLVEINSEWVELRPQDIRSAQTFFESRKDQMSLSLEDALRISTGDTQMIEKLPVLGFEASGSAARADQHAHFWQPKR